MKKRTLQGFLVVLFAAGGIALAGASSPPAAFPDPPAEPPLMAKGPQTAVLAGGCFWGMEGVFERLNGVTDVVSGYSGGKKETAHYEMVGSGVTGHAESIQITYDPARISYGTLLKVFFSVAHDPTELDFQGPDEGTQYRSAIFYANESQKRTAEEYIKALNAARVFGKPIVTEVTPLSAFYPAEDYHQNFMDRNPDYPYIVFWDLPKVAKLEKSYPQLISRR
jgi:peptide-methionine (S)-S-oxide reductase